MCVYGELGGCGRSEESEQSKWLPANEKIADAADAADITDLLFCANAMWQGAHEMAPDIRVNCHPAFVWPPMDRAPNLFTVRRERAIL